MNTLIAEKSFLYVNHFAVPSFIHFPNFSQSDNFYLSNIWNNRIWELRTNEIALSVFK